MRQRLRDQRGMTLIEVSITILLISLGIAATLATYTHFSSASTKAQRQAVMTSIAQQEIERLRGISFGKLGMTTVATAQATAEAPLTGPAAYETPVIGGIVAPGPDSFSVQQFSGRIYRYVTSRAETCSLLTSKVQLGLANLFGAATAAISASLPDLCVVAGQTKRITVAVVPMVAGRPGTPVRLSTIIDNSSENLAASLSPVTLALQAATKSVLQPTPVTAQPVTTQEFTLYDTRCSQPSRQTPSDHQTRDTSQQGFTCTPVGPAPTLMGPDPVGGPNGLAMNDFSTDVSVGNLGGLVLKRDTVAGLCDSQTNMVYANAEADDRKTAIHSWASISPNFVYETPASGGRAALSFYTSTPTGEEKAARLCVTLRRASNGQVLGQSDLRLGNWPGTPTQIVTAMDLDHSLMIPGERLILTLRVPADSGSGVRILYDHKAYPSTLSFTTIKGRELR